YSLLRPRVRIFWKRGPVYVRLSPTGHHRRGHAVDVSGTVRQALASLITETRIEQQILGLRQALSASAGAGVDGGRPSGRRARPRRVRRRMSPAERKAVSARMKALWAKRRGGASKGKTKKG